ncbi:hypothetical protein F0562_021612 [Nyssa sinensis]|uniref:AB hydrolase-1 domain-containing protein n=1 Tax=Nyssa sinensis TaxID=561372 RepID=A0A5J5BPJ2_9ASTE|nr:hypothetical protein F0562_021612 [Nyssa sinensis]
MSRGVALILPLLAFLVFLLSLVGATDDSEKRVMSVERMGKTYPKPHFVLVHGYTGGAWSWYKIRCLLETYGYKVTCLDLKGAGIDNTDSTTIHTFDAYNQPLINFFVNNLSDNEKVILVGHSAGGLSVTDASHKFSKKIQVVIYVAATMLKHGFVTELDKRDGIPNSTTGGNKSDGNMSRLHMSPQEDVVLASMLSRPVPFEVFPQARFRGDGAEHVRRVYIKTKYDQILKPEQQDAMIKKWPPAPSDVYVLDTDHNPLFSDPFALSGLLVKVATSIE